MNKNKSNITTSAIVIAYLIILSGVLAFWFLVFKALIKYVFN